MHVVSSVWLGIEHQRFLCTEQQLWWVSTAVLVINTDTELKFFSLLCLIFPKFKSYCCWFILWSILFRQSFWKDSLISCFVLASSSINPDMNLQQEEEESKTLQERPDYCEYYITATSLVRFQPGTFTACHTHLSLLVFCLPLHYLQSNKCKKSKMHWCIGEVMLILGGEKKTCRNYSAK